MTWAKLDDGILDHPKLAQVGPLGFALYAAGLVYANRNLTDGFIPYSVAARLLPLEWTEPGDNGTEEHGPKLWTVAMTCGMSGLDGRELLDKMVDGLCAAGLWESVPHGYRIHDFPDWNRSRDEVLAEREKTRERVSRLRARRTGNGVTESVGNAERNAVSTVSPVPVPEPVKPKPLASNKSTRVRKLTDEQLADRNLIKDSIVALCGWERQHVTKDAWGRVDGAAKQLQGIGADPPLMRGFADLWAEKYPGAPLTPQAFTNNWPDYMAGKLWPEIRRRR